MGMKLVSIRSKLKKDQLSQLAYNYPDTVGEYWTSGSDAGCDGNFKWCSEDEAFLKEEVHWAQSEPNLKRGDCVWTSTIKYKKKNFLYTENCDVKKRFICEVVIKHSWSTTALN